MKVYVAYVIFGVEVGDLIVFSSLEKAEEYISEQEYSDLYEISERTVF